MEKGHTVDVLDRGFCRYVDHFGSDLRIVESARISYKSPSKGEDADKKLLEYLYKNQHASPFEQCNITFNIKMPIFIMRQFVRHRTFRLNEVSARYTEIPDDFYVPKSWRPQDKKNKQGSVETDNWNPVVSAVEEVSPGGRSIYEIQHHATEELERHCEESYELYWKMITAGISKEMARMVLPINLYTEIYVNCDIRNLMHFFNLRLDEHAQWEIREYAKAMYSIFAELYPWTASAYNKYKFQLVEV